MSDIIIHCSDEITGGTVQKQFNNLGSRYLRVKPCDSLGINYPNLTPDDNYLSIVDLSDLLISPALDVPIESKREKKLKEKHLLIATRSQLHLLVSPRACCSVNQR